MNSYISKKNKIKFIFDESNKQNTDISRKSQNESELRNTVQNNTSVYHIHKLRDFSVDWDDLDVYTSHGVKSYAIQYKVWEIEWNKFDIRLLPFIDIKPMIRIKGGFLENSYAINPYINKVFEVSDITGESSEYYKTIKLIFSIYMYINDTNTSYEGKLNVLFINPRQFI